MPHTKSYHRVHPAWWNVLNHAPRYRSMNLNDFDKLIEALERSFGLIHGYLTKKRAQSNTLLPHDVVEDFVTFLKHYQPDEVIAWAELQLESSTMLHPADLDLNEVTWRAA